MKLSAKMDYALKAMIELALVYPSGKTMQAARIAQKYSISEKFLLQLMIRLKNAKMLRSLRGQGGGYQLALAPEKISVLEILGAVEPSLMEHGLELEKQDDDQVTQTVHQLWKNIHSGFRKQFDDVNLDKLSQDVQRNTASIIYNI